MNPQRWAKIKSILGPTLDMSAEEIKVYLDRVCGNDPSLRQEVSSFLEEQNHLGPRLEGSVLPPEAITEEKLGLMAEAEGHPNPKKPATAPPMEGLVLGSYRLLEELGRGGMGTVYLAERADAVFRRKVAVKLLKREPDHKAALERFRKERQILAELSHPNIAMLLDGGTTATGMHYLVMEYVLGEPIDRYCERLRLSIDKRLVLFRQVCDAVTFAHRRQIIHRDLKPENILVTPEGCPKLLDFGIAKVLGRERFPQTVMTTVTGLRPMTPRYASPEQVLEKPITPLSDIYGLGVLLYELLTGHSPYRVRSYCPEELEEAICHGKPEKPSRVIFREDRVHGYNGKPYILTASDVSATRGSDVSSLKCRLAGGLDAILLKTLQKRPQDRYQSAAQLSSDLENHLNGKPLIAKPVLLKKSQFAAPIKAAIAALVCLFITASHVSSRQEPPEVTIRSVVSQTSQAKPFGDGIFVRAPVMDSATVSVLSGDRSPATFFPLPFARGSEEAMTPFSTTGLKPLNWQPPAEPGFYQIWVRAVTAEGKPLKGLRVDQFAISQGNQAVGVLALEEFQNFENTASFQEHPNSVLISGTPTSRMVIIIDDAFMTPDTFRKSIKALSAWIRKKMPPETQVKLVQINPDLTELAPFSTHKNTLLAGLAKASHQNGFQDQLTDLQFDIVEHILQDPLAQDATFTFRKTTKSLGAPARGLTSQINFFVDQKTLLKEQHFVNFQANMIVLAKEMATYPGLKSAILLSGGFYLEKDSKFRQTYPMVDTMAQAFLRADTPLHTMVAKRRGTATDMAFAHYNQENNAVSLSSVLNKSKLSKARTYPAGKITPGDHSFANTVFENPKQALASTALAARSTGGLFIASRQPAAALSAFEKASGFAYRLIFSWNGDPASQPDPQLSLREGFRGARLFQGNPQKLAAGDVRPRESAKKWADH